MQHPFAYRPRIASLGCLCIVAAGFGCVQSDANSVATFEDALDVSNAGLIAHWPIDEGAGRTTEDITGHGNTGTLINGPAWSDKSTLNLDGVNDHIDVGNLDLAGNVLTMTAWFKSKDLQNCSSWDCRIISKSTGVSSSDHYFMVSTIRRNEHTRLRFRLKTDGATSTLIAHSGDVVENRWTHVAAVYNGTTMQLFMDGVEVGRLSKSGNITTNPKIPCWIGGNPPDATARPWKGEVKDVRVYERPLSGQEIQSLADSNHEPSPSPNKTPLALAHANVTSGHAPLVVRFDGSGSSDPDGVITSYRWDFGDGATSHETNPSHTYLEHGQYPVRLTVVDNANASATSSVLMINVTHEDNHDHGETDPHGDHPDKQREHLALFDLVHHENATHIAINSGDWDLTSTWHNGTTPDHNARVWIPEDMSVTFAHQDSSRFLSVRVDGTLRFDPHQNTLMQVDSLIVNADGLLEIGTLDAPIQSGRVARIVITDRGPIDTTWDPLLLSRGIMTHGKSSIVGAPKTSFVIVDRDPKAGDKALALSRAPTNWKKGDRVLIPGVRKPTAIHDEDEIVAIESIQGTTVTLSRALRYDHSVPRQDLQKVPVANMSRNVIFESENKSDPTRAGHVMFMHSNQVTLQYARFHHMGRNNKNIPTTDPKLDADGHLIASTGTNPRGRYAVHFHRTDINKAAVLVKGCVVEHNPGWGYVNHDSSVIFEDNIAYDTVGSGFATENGNEIGSFVRNLSVRSKISTRAIGFGGSDQDKGNGFGSEGHGFWMQSPGVKLIDNIASGHGQEGYFFHGTFRPKDRSHYEFELQNVIPGVVTHAYGGVRGNKIKAEKVPLDTIRGNHAFGSGVGYAIRWRRRPDTPLSGKGGDVIEDFQVWNVAYKGIAVGYASGMIFRDGVVLGDVNNPLALSSKELSEPIAWAGEEEGLTGRGISTNGNVHDVRYENINIEGFTIGIQATSGGDTGFKDLSLRNIINMRILTPQDAGIADEKVYYGRKVHASGIVNLPLSSKALNGATQYDVYMMTQLKRTAIAGGGSVVEEFKNHVALDEIYYNGKRLYYYEQAAGSIPFRLNDPPYLVQKKQSFIADYIDQYGEYFEKTNQMLMEKFGRTLGGRAAPSSAKDGRSQGIFGLVQDNVPMPAPKIPQWMSILRPAMGHTYTRGQTNEVITWESTGFGVDTVWEIKLSDKDGNYYPIGDGRFPQYGEIHLIDADPSNDEGTHTWSFTWPKVGLLARSAGSAATGTHSLLIAPYRNHRAGFVPFITLE